MYCEFRARSLLFHHLLDPCCFPSLYHNTLAYAYRSIISPRKVHDPLSLLYFPSACYIYSTHKQKKPQLKRNQTLRSIGRCVAFAFVRIFRRSTEIYMGLNRHSKEALELNQGTGQRSYHSPDLHTVFYPEPMAS